MRIWMLAVIAAVSFAVSALLGRVLIPFLHKLRFGQTILDIGPNWHKKKEGTPTMGGLMFIGAMAAGITVTVFLGIAFGGTDMNGDIGLLRMKELIAGTVMAMAFGFVGFIDDYIKVVKKRNLGLSAWGKIILQVIIIAAYFATMRILGNTGTGIPFPFIGTLELGWFYYPLMAIAIIYIVNAVNLLDGVDGLCGSVTVVYAIAFMFIAGTAGYFWQEAYSAALAGALIGFLIYNLHPAKTFMGDTGSMFLGGSVVALGLSTNRFVLILVAGIIYIMDALSVVIQVAYFKATKGKRLFKMSPIHHHFELSGWSENKIVIVFSLVTLIGGLIAVALSFGY